MKRLFQFIEENEKLRVFLRENKDLLIKVAATAAVVVAAFFVFALKGDGQEVKEAEVRVEEETVAEAMIYVDIGGAVQEPKVAKLPEGSRVQDAIEAAGGLTAEANLADINRAAFLNDGEKIYVPGLEEEPAAGSGGVHSDGRININTADSSQLQQVTGIGPVTAEKIIRYREEEGRFQSIEDIKNVSGIGDKTFEKMKDQIGI